MVGSAVIAFFAFVGLDDAITAISRTEAAVGAAFAVCTGVVAVAQVTDFADMRLNNAVATARNRAMDGAVGTISTIACAEIAFFRTVFNTITALNFHAVGHALCRQCAGGQAGAAFAIAVFPRFELAVAASAVLAVCIAATSIFIGFVSTTGFWCCFASCAVVTDFACFDDTVAAVGIFLTGISSCIGAPHHDGDIVGHVTRVTFFVAGHDAIAADGDAGGFAGIEEAIEREFEVRARVTAFGVEDFHFIDTALINFIAFVMCAVCVNTISRVRSCR